MFRLRLHAFLFRQCLVNPVKDGFAFSKGSNSWTQRGEAKLTVILISACLCLSNGEIGRKGIELRLGTCGNMPRKKIKGCGPLVFHVDQECYFLIITCSWHFVKGEGNAD